MDSENTSSPQIDQSLNNLVNSAENLGQGYWKLNQYRVHNFARHTINSFFYLLLGAVTTIIAWGFLALALFDVLRPHVPIELLCIIFSAIHVLLAVFLFSKGQGKINALKPTHNNHTYH